MINKKLGLKVKVKHLAEEAKIIRKEEQRSHGDTRDWLYLHRILTVRPECRATHIAYAFTKGIPLRKVERYPERIPTEVWARVVAMAIKYSDKTKEELTEWLGSSIV
jgi:hypothetical protein